MSKSNPSTRREWIYEVAYAAVNATSEFRGKVLRTMQGKNVTLPSARVMIMPDVMATGGPVTESGQVGLGQIDGTTGVAVYIKFREANDATDDGVVIAAESYLIDVVEQALYGITQQRRAFGADGGAGGYTVMINGATVTSSGAVEVDFGGSVQIVTVVQGVVDWTQLF